MKRIFSFFACIAVVAITILLMSFEGEKKAPVPCACEKGVTSVKVEKDKAGAVSGVWVTKHQCYESKGLVEIWLRNYQPEPPPGWPAADYVERSLPEYQFNDDDELWWCGYVTWFQRLP